MNKMALERKGGFGSFGHWSDFAPRLQPPDRPPRRVLVGP